MSWSRFLTTGSSRLSWRIAWDGVETEFVTNTVMEQTTADNKRRVVGLSTEGLKIEERVDLVLAKWEVSAQSLKVVDVGLEATRLFDTEPTQVSYLDADVTDTATTIPVLDSTGFATSGRIYMNTETIAYSAIATAGFSVSTRGLWSVSNGAAQYHYRTIEGAKVDIEITDKPVMFEGRRVYLYAYGRGDDPQGNGTLVWVGIMSTEPTCTGDVWSFTVDPLSRLLSQDLGADLGDPVSIRGVYYAATAPLEITLIERNGEEANTTSVAAQVRLVMAGFWETQAEFLEELNSEIATRTADPASYGGSGTFTQTIRAEPRPDWFRPSTASATSEAAEWGFAVTFATTPNERWVQVAASSPCDGSRSTRDGVYFRAVSGASVEEVVTVTGIDDGFFPLLAAEGFGGGGVPRCTNGYTLAASGYLEVEHHQIDESTYPPSRLYLSGTTEVTANTRLSVTWLAPPDSWISETVAVSASERYVDQRFPTTDVRPWAATPASPPEIRIVRAYARGNLADFMQSLIDDRAEYLNLGVTPDIRAEDFESGWDTELRDRASLSVVTEDRQYSAVAEVDLVDLIEQECRLIGGFFAMGSSGLFTWRPLRTMTAAEVASSAITKSEIIVDQQWFNWEPNALGMFHTVLHKTGYDFVEDEHTGTEFKYVDAPAKGRAPGGRVLQITPLSQDPPVPLADTFSDRTLSAQSMLAIFAGAYAYLTLDVPFTLFSRLLGDVVSVTSGKPPDSQGGRGMTNRTGLVVGRSWEPREAHGRLTILMLRNFQSGGYTPAAKIDTIDSGTSGTTGPFTVSFTVADYFPSGRVPADYLETGDLIRVYNWGGAAVGVNGVITAIGASSITFTTSAAWVYVGNTWAWGYRPSSSYASSDNEATGYAYLADTNGKVTYSDGDARAFLFGA